MSKADQRELTAIMIQDRTQLLAHYVIYRSKPEKLGATKLNKVMWFSDLEAYRRSGKTISGQQSYQKQKYGPVPNGIVRHLKELATHQKVALRISMTPSGDRKEYIWLTVPDITLFTANEIDIINRAIDYVCEHHTAATISAKTHDALWDTTDIGEQITVKAGTITARATTGRFLSWALDQTDGQAEVH